MSMNNLIISFGGLKGGTGKTTLCTLFATYAVEQGFPVAVMDADTQRSISNNRLDDLGIKNPPTPWRVWPLHVDAEIKERMGKLKKVPGLIVIDCPGSVDNDNLKYVYHSSDVIIIPFRFDRMNVREAATFAETVRKISKAKLLFLPNMVTQYDDQREELVKAMERANTDLGKYGRILPCLPDRLAIRVSNTLGMNYKQRQAVRESFDAIIEVINPLNNK